MKLLFRGKEVKFANHPSIEEPFCPFCGKKLYSMKCGGEWIGGIGLDWLLFCKRCKILWYKRNTWFSLEKIDDVRRWGFEIIPETT